jgi:hypothetical protein
VRNGDQQGVLGVRQVEVEAGVLEEKRLPHRGIPEPDSLRGRVQVPGEDVTQQAARCPEPDHVPLEVEPRRARLLLLIQAPRERG